MLLALVLVASFLLSLLEVARIKSIDFIAGEQTELAVLNTFAEYHQALWEEYRILGRNLSSLENDIIKHAKAGNKEESMSLFNFSVNQVCDLRYTLVTDKNGRLFIKGISNDMQESILSENIQSLYSAYEAIKGLLENQNVDLENIDTALEYLNSQSGTQQEMQQEHTNVPNEITLKKNPLEVIKKLQKQGILQLVLKEPDSVSEKAFETRNLVSKRAKKEGTLEADTNINWTDTVLFQQYLLQYFGCYGKEKENSALSYELEYLIGKKQDDTANLKATVNKILLTRQAVNLLYLLSDAKKTAMARSVALGFVAVGVPPSVIEILKTGILTAWAYAESILDLRTLLAGKKIPLIKSSYSWTLEIDKIANIGNGFPMAKESENGISYENYVRVLLFFEQEEELAFRAMDIMEAYIQKKDADFWIDEIVIGTEIEIEYLYGYVFLGFQFLPIYQKHNPVMRKNTKFFYTL